MSKRDRRTKEQIADAEYAAKVSDTAFVARDDRGNVLGVYDYGKDAGVGTEHVHLPENRIEAGVKRGRETEFMAALRGMDDSDSRRLLEFAQAGRREFNRELARWVRERLTAGNPIPDAVDWQRKRV